MLVHNDPCIKVVRERGKRIKILYLPRDGFFQLVRLAFQVMLTGKPAEIAWFMDGIPEDSLLVDVREEWQRDAFAFLIWSKEFPEVPLEQSIPDLFPVGATSLYFPALEIRLSERLANHREAQHAGKEIARRVREFADLATTVTAVSTTGTDTELTERQEKPAYNYCPKCVVTLEDGSTCPVLLVPCDGGMEECPKCGVRSQRIAPPESVIDNRYDKAN